MRKFKNSGIVRLLVGSLLFLTFSLVGCSPEAPAAVETPIETDTPASSENTTDNSSLFVSDMQWQLWQEKGIGTVKTVSAAEQMMGFTVAVPGYLPEGFTLRTVEIGSLGAGLPEALKPKWDSRYVTQRYHWGDGTYEYIGFTQSQHKNYGGGEPFELNGQPAERVYDNTDTTKPPMLDLNWEMDGKYFSLNGWISGPLDEATLVKIASSVAFKN